ncbi:MAG: tRNA (N(6)-L-threonylcarbamoyladenosine(37)-C(2))-methylthiotransferase MtaB [Clostridia bacterium]|nr:tRNA (N(6)-L-threonylcarbamoyladenosine(37)-C(2))-methylthiotransferase MtaB [Clostridia bacterium]
MEKCYKISILTLGCRVNQYESDYIAKELEKIGACVVPFSRGCDAYIINTCTVTGESDRKSRQIIRRCVKANPEAIIVVTGCYSQVNKSEVEKICGVSLVCDSNSKSQIPRLVMELLNNQAPTYNMTPCEEFDKICVGVSPTRTRAFVKIEDGCNSKCAYCIIPTARGKVRSAPMENIISELTQIAKSGCYEVVLTGIETAAYGKDLKNGETLSTLLCRANKIEGIERIRLGSLDPSSITKEFVDSIKGLDKVMPHFHLSMQSGCTKTLNEMKRKYSIEMAKSNIDYLKSQIDGVMLSCDIITGFPNESDEDFESTYNFFKNEKFLHLHIFPYSKRKGTLAYDMPNQVDERIKKERLYRLKELEKEIKLSLLSDFISKNSEGVVLFENNQEGYACGHLPNFMEVKMKASESLQGQLVRVKLISTDGNYIYAEKI